MSLSVVTRPPKTLTVEWLSRTEKPRYPSSPSLGEEVAEAALCKAASRCSKSAPSCGDSLHSGLGRPEKTSSVTITDIAIPAKVLTTGNIPRCTPQAIDPPGASAHTPQLRLRGGPKEVRTLTDVDRSLRDHERAEDGIRPPIARAWIDNLLSRVVCVSCLRLARLVRPAARVVLSVPVIVRARPDHEGNVPAGPGA